MMDSSRQDERNGQVLVQVAMLMVVLFAFMAIAIDVGHIFNERRRMQNAADAGALAGAWEICFGSGTQEAAEATAKEYAEERNGAQDSDVTFPDGWRVKVLATETTELYIARVIGISTADVGATAVSACGAPDSACGLWPVALRESRWEDLWDEENGCGREFYVWSGDKTKQNPDCEVFDCDVLPAQPGDGVLDIVDMDGRAFVDFSELTDPEYSDDCEQPGCGANELACWIVNDSGARIEIDSCIAGLTGVKAGVKDDVDWRAANDPVVTIPIYDETPCSAAVCPGGRGYHLAGFACINVIGWVHELELPRKDGGNPPWKGKAIHVSVECDSPNCQTHCGSTTGEPPLLGGLRAVSLIE